MERGASPGRSRREMLRRRRERGREKRKCSFFPPSFSFVVVFEGPEKGEEIKGGAVRDAGGGGGRGVALLFLCVFLLKEGVTHPTWKLHGKQNYKLCRPAKRDGDDGTVVQSGQRRFGGFRGPRRPTPMRPIAGVPPTAERKNELLLPGIAGENGKRVGRKKKNGISLAATLEKKEKNRRYSNYMMHAFPPSLVPRSFSPLVTHIARRHEDEERENRRKKRYISSRASILLSSSLYYYYYYGYIPMAYFGKPRYIYSSEEG